MFKNFISDSESIGALLNVPVSIIAKSRSFVTTILTLTLLAFLLVWYVQYIWRRRYLYYYSWNIPGPFAFPFIGCTYLFLAAKTGDIMDTLIDMQKKYPEIGQMWFGPKLMFTVSKPEHIEKILTSQKALDKDDLYKFISCAVGEGLLTARGQKWKKHRKVIMPAFNQKILNNFQKIFARQGEIFTEHLHRQSGNKDLDLFKLLSNCTLDIICGK
ncbi:unnamed protein product [Psylliodes chrysocephalus]|uniref:Cytochrome P450 n=1 Tax=Psylliodes chrysocephalus TaxID=3402493 RepID=A0A9P0GJG5_9CUCU|nr:unnamed protein product [Psylliodes chrysocephala]